ncbi:DUF6242 domain-containing protein [Marinifilum fragile]|uniref:Kelch repeat-containing protein n=1 Tax=Marinifilum fragile TaxID=570161 RepID=UPI002AA91DF1|nr:DUF6242 domain-containing protein [Marinifilum fragile]
MKVLRNPWSVVMLLFAMVFSGVLSSCSDDEKLSNLTGFLSFEFNEDIISNYDFVIGADGTITNESALPYGFDCSSLQPVFTSAPLSTVLVNDVEQVSGQSEQDFSSDIVYEVVAEDGTTAKTYTVRVNVATEISAWTKQTADAGFPNYDYTHAFKVGGKYFISGGESTDYTYSLYSSEDGATWTVANDNFLAEGVGVGYAAVKYNDNILLIGGHTLMDWSDWSTGQAKASVYSSADGENWTDVAAETAAENKFSARTEPMVANMNGDLYLVGGSTLAYGSPSGPINDVWKSVDGGVNWTQLETNLGDDFTPRFRGQLLVYNNELYLIGGESKYPTQYNNEVYKSADGATWTKVEVATPFTARSQFVAYEYAGRIFVVGGKVVTGEMDGSAQVAEAANDTWVSEDGGVNWTQMTEGVIDFEARYGHSLIQDGNNLMIVGGKGAAVDGATPVLKDVWTGTLN